MIFSSRFAGVDQSMVRSTRKPRLNQDEKRWRKSSSMAARSSRWSIASSSWARMRTSAAVPPGARLRRRKSSSRRGSDERWSLDAAASEGAFIQAVAAALSRARSGPKPLASASKKAMRGPGLQLGIAGQNLARERHPRGFAAAGEQILAQMRKVGRALLGDPAPIARDQRAAALRDRLQHIAEKRGVHGDGPNLSRPPIR